MGISVAGHGAVESHGSRGYRQLYGERNVVCRIAVSRSRQGSWMIHGSCLTLEWISTLRRFSIFQFDPHPRLSSFMSWTVRIRSERTTADISYRTVSRRRSRRLPGSSGRRGRTVARRCVFSLFSFLTSFSTSVPVTRPLSS